eukprot:3034988-Amphidinium_carterae.1
MLDILIIMLFTSANLGQACVFACPCQALSLSSTIAVNQQKMWQLFVSPCKLWRQLLRCDAA